MKNKLKLILKRTKKLRRLLLCIFIIVLFCMYLFLKPRNYTYDYKINNISVTESYNKKEKYYSFTFKKGNNLFEYEVPSKYHSKRGLVSFVSIKKDCIKIKSSVENFNVCSSNNGYVMPYYKTTNKDKYSKTYKNIKLYNLKDYKYYVWNYKTLLSITEDKQDDLKLFKDDLYSLNLTTTSDKYLLIPDYSNEYYFKKIYKINSKNDDIKELELNKTIYFDSYFLGNYKNDTYIYDLNKNNEYKINIKNGKVTKTSYELLINGKWEDTTEIKLNKKNQSFRDSKNFEFITKDGKLYYKTPSTKIMMTNIHVDRMLYSNDKEAFFLSKDTVFCANLNDGISRVMKYSEWEFNNKNIYIFEK